MKLIFKHLDWLCEYTGAAVGLVFMFEIFAIIGLIKYMCGY